MRLLILAIAALFALSACYTKTHPPGDAPTGVQADPGDGLVVVHWDTLPDLTYWIFYEPGGTVAVDTPESIAIRGAVSPRLVVNLVNGIDYAFVMNATQDGSAAGPNSVPVVQRPRLAGFTGSWTTGIPLPAPPQNLKSIAFSGARFVAVGDAATIFAGDFNYPSTNPNPEGVTAWVPATLPAGFVADLSSVIYNGTFVALGTDGSIISSLDGLTWTANSRISATGVSGMNGLSFGFAAGVATYIAVGNGGAIFATTNLATSWTPLTSGTTSDLTSVSVLNTSFVVTGSGGTLLRSRDGSSVDPPLVSNTTSTLRAAVFNPNPLLTNQYIAVGDAGTVVASNDGATWNQITITPPLTQVLRSVTIGGATATRFLAVGQGGAVAYSDNGLTWLSASAGPSNNLASVLFPRGLYLAVGDAGANAVSR